MSTNQHEDLEWLAFRYVAAELPPGESREFERRLEHDQEAREAVGRAVEVTCAVRSLDWSDPCPARRDRRFSPWYRRRAVPVICGLALALLAFLLVWGPFGNRRAQRRDGGLAALPPVVELAEVWNNARTEISERLAEDEAGWRGLPQAERPADVSGWKVEEPLAETPDWMVTAVAASESEDDDQPAPATHVEGI